MTDTRKAYGFALLAVLGWSTAAAAFKIALRDLEVLQILAAASISSALVLGAVVLIQGKASQLRTQTRIDIRRSAVTGLLTPFLYYAILLEAYDRLLAQQAQPLNFTWPIVLALLSAVFLKQRLRPRDVIALFISFAGVIVIATKGKILTLADSDPLGVALALGSSTIWASYWILNLRDPRDAVIKLMMGFAFGALYSTTAALIAHGPNIPQGLPLAICVYIGLFEMGLTFAWWLIALHLAGDNARMSNLVYLTPFLALVFIYFVTGEVIHLSSLAGLCLIVAGLLTQAAKRERT